MYRKFGEQIVNAIMKLFVKMLEKHWDCSNKKKKEKE